MTNYHIGPYPLGLGLRFGL